MNRWLVILALTGVSAPRCAAPQVLDIDLPPVATTTVDTPLMLSRATFDAPTVAGAPLDGESLRLTVSAGALTLAEAPIAILDAPPDPSTVTFIGPGVAEALDGLVYTPPPGFAGGVDLTLEVLGPNPRFRRINIAVNAPLDDGQARAALLDGVGALHGGVQPGQMVAFGETAADVAFYPGGVESGPMVVAARWGAGRVVAMGDHQALNMHAYGGPAGADSGRFYHNALGWLAAGNARQAVIATTSADVAGWLTAQGYADVRVLALDALPDTLPAVDVFVPPWLGTRVPDGAYVAIGDFVRGGGGLLICEYGVGWDWWWGQPKPDAPGNRLLREAGVGFVGGNRWEDGTLALAAAAGRLTATDLLAVLADPGGAEAAVRGRAGVLLDRIFDALQPDDPLARRLDAALDGAFAAVSPTPGNPVDDPWDKALLDREDSQLRALAPADVPAHRSADALYGPVPDDAPRIARRVVIDPAVTRWHAVGLYAPPGELIEVEVPQEALDADFRLRINGHTDDMSPRDTWLRPPRVHWSAPLDGPRIDLSNPFGGTIYIDVGTTARDRAPFELIVHGGVEQPWFVLGRDTDADWAAVRDAPGPYAELQSPRLSISLPSAMIRELADPEALMALWDAVVEAQDGIGHHAALRTNGERINIDVQVAYGYLHAGYPTQGPLVAGPELVDHATLSRRGSWGWFHELGHEAQRRPDKSWGWNNPYTFDGSVEATVNIFTAWANHALGLRPEGGWGWTPDRVPTMRRALDAVAAGPYRDLGAGEKLAMFLQLRDGFGWDAIGAIIESYQQGPLPDGEQAERDEFLIRASQVTGHDLSRFLGDVWGLALGDDARAAVADLPDWLPAMGTVVGPFDAVGGVPRVIDVGAGTLSHDGIARIELEALAARGAIEGPVDGVFTYTAGTGYSGPDSFRYAVISSTGHRQVETVTLNVHTEGVLLERWSGIPGESVDDLRADPRFPAAPDSIEVLAGPRMAPGWGDAYGARMRGHIVVPPADGDYVFWIASDDNGELWLSRDHTFDTPALIARVPGWSGAEQWDRFPEQRSARVPLEGGRAYAFEALMKEGAGGDHMAIAWARADDAGVGEPTVIAADATRPWRPANAPPTAANTAETVPPDLESVLDLDVGDPDGDGLHVISARADRGAVVVDGSRLRYRPPAGYEGPARIDYTIGDGRGGEASARIELTVFEWLRVTPTAPLGEWAGGECVRFEWAPVPEGRARRYALLLDRAGEVERYEVPRGQAAFDACFAIGDGPLVWRIEASRDDDPRRFVSDGGMLRIDQTPPTIDPDGIDIPRGAACLTPPTVFAWAAAEDAGVGLADEPYTLELWGDADLMTTTAARQVVREEGLPAGEDGVWWALTVRDRLGNSETWQGRFFVDCAPPELPGRWSGVVHGGHTVDAPLETGFGAIGAEHVSLWADGSLCFSADRACDPPEVETPCARPLGPDPATPAGAPAIEGLPFGALLIHEGPDGWAVPREADPFSGELFGGGNGGPIRLAVNSAAPSGCRAPGYGVTLLAGLGPATLLPIDDAVVADDRPLLLFTGVPDFVAEGHAAEVGVWLDGAPRRRGGPARHPRPRPVARTAAGRGAPYLAARRQRRRRQRRPYAAEPLHRRSEPARGAGDRAPRSRRAARRQPHRAVLAALGRRGRGRSLPGARRRDAARGGRAERRGRRPVRRRRAARGRRLCRSRGLRPGRPHGARRALLPAPAGLRRRPARRRGRRRRPAGGRRRHGRHGAG